MIRPANLWLFIAVVLLVANIIVGALGGNINSTNVLICIATAAILVQLEKDDE